MRGGGGGGVEGEKNIQIDFQMEKVTRAAPFVLNCVKVLRCLVRIRVCLSVCVSV